MGVTLVDAADKGNLAQVKELIAQGAKLDGTDADPEEMEDGRPLWLPLAAAAKNGHIDVINALLDAGANIDDRTAGGDTALHQAAFFGQAKAVELLLSRGADVHSVNRSGNALQNMRFGKDHLPKAAAVAKLLLAKGCSPTDRNGNAESLLEYLTRPEDEDDPLTKTIAKPLLALLEVVLPHAGTKAADVKKQIAVCEKALGIATKAAPTKVSAKKAPAKKAPAKKAKAKKTNPKKAKAKKPASKKKKKR